MSTQLLVCINEPLKQKVTILAESQGKTVSHLVRELLETYARERDAESYISDLWKRISHKLHKKEISWLISNALFEQSGKRNDQDSYWC